MGSTSQNSTGGAHVNHKITLGRPRGRPPAPGGRRSGPKMDRAAAVASRVVHLRGVLSDTEIKHLDALYDRVRAEESDTAAALPSTDIVTQWTAGRSGPKPVLVTAAQRASFCEDNFSHPNLTGLRDSGHIMCFFQSETSDRIAKQLPDVLATVVGAMQKADHWGLLQGGSEVRVCEYHHYSTGGQVCDPKHVDSGSLLTMSVLLNEPDEFEGGAFTTLEADGSVTSFADFQRGDGLLFVSEKWHSVQVGPPHCPSSPAP
eukprot:COSAG05_NODE_1003_length_6237_cov_7.337732_9_plen_260_part_00